MNNLKKLSALVFLLVFSSLALAGGRSDRSTMYVGVGNTWANTTICDGVVGSCDEDDNNISYFAGFTANETYAFEYTHFKFDDLSFANVKANELSGLYMYPIMDKTSIYVRVGGAAIEAGGDNVKKAIWGVGADINVYGDIDVRLDYRRYSDIDTSLGSIDADLLGVSAAYTF